MIALTDRLEVYVLPAASEYMQAEVALSEAFKRERALASETIEAFTAKRKAMELAVAIDAMRERAAAEFLLDKEDVHREVSRLCVIRSADRPGCLDRIRAVAAAYRHPKLSDPRLPINSEDDVLIVGAGYGIDAYGIGKVGGIEVLVRLKDGSRHKFLGDAPYAVAGWVTFLREHSHYDPGAPIAVCGVHIN